MTSPSNRKAVPALLALLLPLLTLVACNSAYTGTNPGTGTNYPFLSAVTLQPGSAPSIAVAGTVQVGANGAYQVSATEIQYNDVTTSATWSSSNDAVATVSKGLVTGTGIGSATISASLNGKTGKTLVVVGQTATLDITATGTGVFSLSANPDQHFQASASYSDGTVLDLTIYATWSSSVPGVLKFYPFFDYTHDPGEATLLATGTTTITATLDSGDVGALDVTVVP
jgi:hypothetical protein